MLFRTTFADPFKPQLVELGQLTPEQIHNAFRSAPWNELVAQINADDGREVYYSPSLGVENPNNKHGISLSAIDRQEWLIFYTRPKLITKRSLFGKKEVMDENYMSEKTVQGTEDVLRCLQAFLDGNSDELELMFA
jgi:hypothetical protein